MAILGNNSIVVRVLGGKKIVATCAIVAAVLSLAVVVPFAKSNSGDGFILSEPSQNLAFWLAGYTKRLESSSNLAALQVRIVRPGDSRELRQVFDGLGYDLKDVRQGATAVPRLYVTRLPADLADITDIKTRKATFLRTVLPLVLIANEEIRAMRQRVRILHQRREMGGRITPSEQSWLEAVAARYGVTPDNMAPDNMTADNMTADNMATLLRSLDEVPVSLALAQAIQESGWGGSRFAVKGHALYGQRTWSDARLGLVPVAREQDESFRVQTFADLMAAVRSYMHNLNTHPAYDRFRGLRAETRRKNHGLDAFALARTLDRYAEEGDGYIETLQGLIRINDLSAFDTARLQSGDLAERSGWRKLNPQNL